MTKNDSTGPAHTPRSGTTISVVSMTAATGMTISRWTARKMNDVRGNYWRRRVKLHALSIAARIVARRDQNVNWWTDATKIIQYIMRLDAWFTQLERATKGRNHAKHNNGGISTPRTTLQLHPPSATRTQTDLLEGTELDGQTGTTRGCERRGVSRPAPATVSVFEQ